MNQQEELEFLRKGLAAQDAANQVLCDEIKALRKALREAKDELQMVLSLARYLV